LPNAPEPQPPGRCHARSNGLSLHAALVIPAGQRERLERPCRYVVRPPVAVDRLHLTSDGHVRVSLRERRRDGTTDFVFDPVDFLGRIAPAQTLLLPSQPVPAMARWMPNRGGRQFGKCRRVVGPPGHRVVGVSCQSSTAQPTRDERLNGRQDLLDIEGR